MIVISTASPSDACLEETISTLKFSHRASRVPIQVKANENSIEYMGESMSGQHLALQKARRKIKELKNELKQKKSSSSSIHEDEEWKREKQMRFEELDRWKNQASQLEENLSHLREDMFSKEQELSSQISALSNQYEKSEENCDELRERIKYLEAALRKQDMISRLPTPNDDSDCYYDDEEEEMEHKEAIEAQEQNRPPSIHLPSVYPSSDNQDVKEGGIDNKGDFLPSPILLPSLSPPQLKTSHVTPPPPSSSVSNIMYNQEEEIKSKEETTIHPTIPRSVNEEEDCLISQHSQGDAKKSYQDVGEGNKDRCCQKHGLVDCVLCSLSPPPPKPSSSSRMMFESSIQLPLDHQDLEDDEEEGGRRGGGPKTYSSAIDSFMNDSSSRCGKHGLSSCVLCSLDSSSNNHPTSLPSNLESFRRSEYGVLSSNDGQKEKEEEEEKSPHPIQTHSPLKSLSSKPPQTQPHHPITYESPLEVRRGGVLPRVEGTVNESQQQPPTVTFSNSSSRSKGRQQVYYEPTTYNEMNTSSTMNEDVSSQELANQALIEASRILNIKL